MYKSPIEIIYGELQTQMVQENENMVMKAVRKVGVDVDKEALIKALQYDRNQYINGYEDGKNDVLNKIREEITDRDSIKTLEQDSKTLTEAELFKLIRGYYGINKEDCCFISIHQLNHPESPIYIATDWGRKENHE